MIKAVIFDMDGVISDTQKLHAEGESRLLARFGIHLTPAEVTKKYAGVRTKDFLNALLKTTKQTYNLDKLLEEKWQTMERLAAQSVEPVPGALRLIKKLNKDGVPLAVASASTLNYIKTVLGALGITEYFDVIVSSEMVTKGKPHPDIFLLAAKKLGLKPINCLVIEDGISGMEAAKAAHMKCIGLVADKEKIYPTPNLVLSLAEITPQYLKTIS